MDGLNRQTQVQDALGDLSTTVYDLVGNVTNTIDARGDRATYTFDALKRQTQMQDAVGNLSTTVYDNAGNATATIDARGDRTTYSFDGINRQTQIQDGAANLSTTVYDLAGNVTTTIDARGDRTTYSFDARNRQTQVQDALGNLSTTMYDAAGNVTVSMDPLGHRTTFSYDNANRQTQVQDALGHLSTTLYDTASNVTTTIDALSRRTTYSFDRLNRQTQVQDALGNLSTTLYDQAGNVTTTIDARSDRTTYAYDQLNRQAAVTDPLSHINTTVYDQAGNVTTTIDASGLSTTYAFDKDNRQTTVQDQAGDITTTVYDQAGNVTNTIDPLNHTTTYAFDQDNRQTAVTDPRGAVTTTVYDQAGNTTNIIDPVGNKTTFVFDALNRQTQMIDPLGHGSTMAFDAAGRLTSQTDRNGNVISYSYDAINRKTGETWVVSGSTVNTFTYTYDAINELTAANSPGTYTFSYDALNRATVTKDPSGMTLTASYDQVGNRTLLQDSLNGVLTSLYDQANRLTSRQFGGTSQTQMRLDLTYTPRNQIASETRFTSVSGGTTAGTSSFTYDPAMRLTSLQHRDSGANLLANYTYTYDLASRATSEQLNGTTTSYGYDAANELTSFGSTNYSYDLNGNRTMTGYRTGTENQLLNDGVWTYTYDNNGNLIEQSMGASATTVYYAYDNENHLTSAKQEASPGGTLQMQATYAYDALRNRVEKDVWTTSGLVVTRFAYDGGNVWADLNSSNQLQMRRLYLDGVDQVFARISSSGTGAWYLPDRLGSIRDIMNYAGTGTPIIDHIDYDGFGNVSNETQSSNGDRYKWTGREFDSETGLQYNRARYYAGGIGRWITQDPVLFASGDANFYRYVGNSPLNAWDYTGLSVFIRDITVTNQSPSGFQRIPQLGPLLSEAQFQYGFKVTVRAWVCNGDDITKADIKQNIFYAASYVGFWSSTYLVTSASHPSPYPGSPPSEVNGFEYYEAWRAFQPQYGDSWRTQVALDGDNSYWYAPFQDTAVLQTARHGTDELTWVDSPGLVFSVPPSNWTSASVLFGVEILATGTDGDTTEARFSVQMYGKWRNGWSLWTVPTGDPEKPGSVIVDPSLPFSRSNHTYPGQN